MRFLQWELDAHDGDIVNVQLDHAANVRLLDPSNFHNYRQGRQHRYIGGFYKHTPVNLRVPHAGRWYVVVDLGGYQGRVNASVRVL